MDGGRLPESLPEGPVTSRRGRRPENASEGSVSLPEYAPIVKDDRAARDGEPLLKKGKRLFIASPSGLFGGWGGRAGRGHFERARFDVPIMGDAARGGAFRQRRRGKGQGFLRAGKKKPFLRRCGGKRHSRFGGTKKLCPRKRLVRRRLQTRRGGRIGKARCRKGGRAFNHAKPCSTSWGFEQPQL